MSIAKSLGAITLAGAASLASFSVAADELKLAHFSSTKYHLHNEMFLPLAEGIKQATNGDTTIRVYPGGELGKGPAKQYDRVIDGVADIVYAIPGYTAAQFKKTLVIELPGVLPRNANKTEAIWNNIELLNKEFKRTKLLGLWTAKEAVLLMADKKVTSLADLDGLKIRVPSKNTGRVVEAWGATAVSMPITQVYTSMETGVVDGVLVDASVLKSFKLGEVTKYVTTGMNGTNSAFLLVMNRDSWNDLDSATQAKLEGLTGAEMSEGGRVTMTNAADKALAAWIANGGELVELSDASIADFNAATDNLASQVVAELEAEGIKAGEWVAALNK